MSVYDKFNEKAFSLIEILAVIVILALIALITTPIMIGITENSRKKSFENSAYGVINSVKHYYVDKLSKNLAVGEHKFTFPTNELSLSGNMPAGGMAKLHSDGQIEIAIHDNRFCATKNIDEDAVTVKDYVEGECDLSADLGLLKDNIMNLVDGKSTNSSNMITVQTSDSSCTNTFVFDQTSDNNLRYVGKNPCNYIYFNCDNSSDSSTCELWRIIGVMNNVKGTESRIKIIKEDSIGSYSWDSSKTGEEKDVDGSESRKGLNNWKYADIMHTMNNLDNSFDYSLNNQKNIHFDLANNALYWNRTNGYCSANDSNDVRACDFGTSGLKETTKKYIDEVTWNISGTHYSNGFGNAPQIYTWERKGRDNRLRSGRERTWMGKVALPYPSDYVYASGENAECLTSSPAFWSSTTNAVCLQNYLNKGTNFWTLQMNHNNNHYALYVQSSGKLADTAVSTPYDIYPTLYLTSDALLREGNGSKNNPYKLK